MLDELIEELKPYRREEIAAETGFSFSTISGLLSGVNKNPSYNLLQALRRFLDERK